MKRIYGWMRISIVMSIIWFMFFAIGGLAYDDIAGALSIAIIPIVVAFVVLSIVDRLKPTKTDKVEDEKVDIDTFTKKLRGMEVKLNRVRII